LYDEYDDEFIETLKNHTISLIIGSYLRTNPTEKQSFLDTDKLRYKTYRDIERLQKTFKDHYLFEFTTPLTPISLNYFDTVDKELIDKKVKFIESLAELYAELSPKNNPSFFIENKYEKLRDNLKESYSKDVIQAKRLRDYMSDNNKYLEKNRKKLFSFISQALKEMYDWAESKARNGAQGYGFISALIFWGNCPDGTPSNYAIDLLDLLDENICPAYIKKTAKQHAPVRQVR